MKILALRVKNLTSLAGEIALDFEAPPLAQAGLFAITGPTGAGKSTLLDALCLALYDELPRLAQGGDVKSVLRHGAGEGYAEVDFIGRDGGRYRARWEVRRARNRADGRVQAQALSLTDLATGTITAGGKRETLRAIEDKVGLDYHQFRRSVLLAQNDFDAFLRAKPDDRAGLLELMTGTAIYGELSQAAYERCKAEEYSLRALDEELKRVNVLADDERAAVEAEAAQAEIHAAHLADEVEGLKREVEWYRTATDLNRQISEAVARHEEAKTRWTAAQPERDRMARVRRALALAPLAAEVTRLGAERTRLETEHLSAQETLAACESELARLEGLRDAARNADEAAEAAFKAAGPTLDQAAELDTRLAEAHERLEPCRAAVRESANLVEQSRRTLHDLTVQKTAQADVLAGLEKWLADHREHKPLAEQSERWLDAIAAYAQAAGERRAASAQVERSKGEQHRLGAELASLQDQSTDLASRLAELDCLLAEQVALAEGVDVDALERRRAGLDDLIDALGELEGLAASASTLGRRAQEIDARRRDAEVRRIRARESLVEVDAALATARAALPEAEAALALAEAAECEQAVVLRQRLLEDEPCPVCGSREHPVGEIHTALTALLGAQRRRVQDLRTEHDHLVTRQSDAKAEERSASETLSHAAADVQSIAGERGALAERWETTVVTVLDLAESWDFGLSPLPDQLSDEGVDGDVSACELEGDAIADQLRAARSAEADRRRLSAERDGLQTQALELTRQRTEMESSRAEWTAKLNSARADMERALTTMEQAAGRLALPLEPIAEWRQLLDTPDLLADRVSQMAGDWLEKSAQIQGARDALQVLASKCDSAATGLQTAERNAERDRTVEADEQKGLDRLTAARAELFDGRPTAEVRTELDAARRIRKDEFQRAQDAWAKAAQDRSAAQERVSILADSRSANASAEARAVATRDSRLSDEGIALAEIVEAVALGEGWLAATEAAQAALRDAELETRTVLEERRQQLAGHLAAGRPEREEADILDLLPTRIAERDAARDQLNQLRHRLTEDDRNRGAAEDTRRRIGEQRNRHDLWKGMADLIGSADGKKFRLFAQGLTLDRLLGLANRHMADLTPRYVLQRAPGADLDLQVIDRDMADEIRAVANLSGGERFLVSLSLALGLASMTGARTLAESLFIDEGFGALDAESLDVAIGALETLHASGRKVGVISHVQPMIDRIGVQIRVSKQGGGRSVVETRAA